MCNVVTRGRMCNSVRWRYGVGGGVEICTKNEANELCRPLHTTGLYIRARRDY
jgi:hypothetical protein